MQYKDEYVSIRSCDPVRQGDIFRWIGHDNPAAAQWGLILTADCDIAQGKTGENYTYVPIVSARYYITKLWPAGVLTRLHSDLVHDAANLIYSLHSAFDADITILPHNDVVDWLLSRDDNSILDALRCEDPALRDSATYIFNAVRRTHANTLSSEDNLLSVVCSIWSTRDKRSPKAQRNAIKTALVQMRLDTFFLTYLPSEEDLGFIALLRDVHSIPTTAIYTNLQATKLTRQLPPYAYRVARLNDYLKYAIVHQFASVFLRIAIPAHYEKDREQIIDNLCDQLISVTSAVSPLRVG